MAKLKKKYVVHYHVIQYASESGPFYESLHRAETWAVSEAKAHSNLYYRGVLYDERDGYGGSYSFTSIIKTEEAFLNE